MEVADQNGSPFLGRTLGNRKTNARTSSSSDDDGFAFEQPARFWIGWNVHASPLGSRGMPSALSAIMLRWIWLVPP